MLPGSREPGSPTAMSMMSQETSTQSPVQPPELVVTIPAWSVIWRQDEKAKSKFAIFDILVQAGTRQWMVHRRYSDFCALDDACGDVAGARDRKRLPRRRYFGNFDSGHLEQRRADLEAYLVALVDHEVLSREPFVLDFLGARTNLGSTDPSYDSFGFVMRSGHHKHPIKLMTQRSLNTQRTSEAREDLDCSPACAIM